MPPAIKPGVIPLRPLTLTDILNGAFSYIRTNPKATLGLTTVVVVIAQLIGLVLQIGPLAAMGELGVLARRGGVDGRGSGLVCLRARQRDHHAAVVDRAQRHAHGHRGSGGVRRGHHDRRGVAAGPRATACPCSATSLLWLLAVAVPVVHRGVRRRHRCSVQRCRGVRPRHPARTRLDCAADLPVDGAQLRSAADRVGAPRRVPVDQAVRKAGQGRLLAGAGNPASGNPRRRSRRGSGVDTVQPDRPDHADGFGIHHDDTDLARARRRSAARSARSSPRRSAPARWCSSTPTGGSAPRRSTWCCKRVRHTRHRVRRRTRPITCGSPGSPDVPAIDIDRDAAHEAAQRELAKPIYPKASLTERLSEWLNDLIYRIAQEGAQLPGGWFTITLLLIILAVAIVVAVRIARRTMRTNRGGEHALFDSHELTAAQHRATAEQYAAEGNWAAAIRHRLRADRTTARGGRGAQPRSWQDCDRARGGCRRDPSGIWAAN